MEQPINLICTGVGPRLKTIIEKNNCVNWAVKIIEANKEGSPS